MTSRRLFPVLFAAAATALLLAGCDTGAATPTPSVSASKSAEASPGASMAPTPTTAPTPASVTLPTDCSQVGRASVRAQTVDTLTLQGDGVGFVRPAPAGATLALGCDWFAGDATGILLLLSTAPAADVVAATATLPAQGYVCTPDATGETICTMATPNSQYPVDTVETIVARDSVWIYLATSNIDGSALLTEIVHDIFD